MTILKQRDTTLLKKRIENGKTIHKKNKFALQSDQDLIEYFSEYENLLLSMNKYGYDVNIDQDDILIWIGPNGELIKCTGGRHRFAASRVTGISCVPLRIKYIHTDWIRSQMKYTKPATDQIRIKDIRYALKKVRYIYNHQDDVN